MGLSCSSNGYSTVAIRVDSRSSIDIISMRESLGALAKPAAERRGLHENMEVCKGGVT